MNVNSYEIKVGEPTVDLNSQTYCPQSCLPINIGVQCTAQHDGPAWSDDDVLDMESDMYENIMIELEAVVSEHIKNTKPFACHQELKQ